LQAARISVGVLVLAAAVGLSADAASAGVEAQHSVGLGGHALLLRTDSSDQYLIQGPALAYDVSIGRRWGVAARLAAFLPLLGSMDGPSGSFSGSLVETYDLHRYGVDALILGARRVQLAPRVRLLVGVGPHVQWFSLAGRRYSPVEDASLGIGGLGKIGYAFNGWLSASTQLAIGLDPIDLQDHRNPARLVVPLSWTFALDARY